MTLESTNAFNYSALTKEIDNKNKQISVLFEY
jgi:hypothetical protein